MAEQARGLEARPLRRVLVANRGEIAIRIARAAAALGVESVGVYPAADGLALHPRMTTDACALTGDDPVAAYLDIEALITAAAESGCDAVHPGYGFLSENAAFAARCAEAGLTFIGPSPATLTLFGDKVAARAFAESVGVPVVPGSVEPVASAADARALGAVSYTHLRAHET